MATKIAEFPEMTRKPRATKYPYEQWLDGNIWELVRGEDFTVPVASLRAALSIHNSKNGLAGVKTRLITGTDGIQRLIIQAKSAEPEPEPTEPTPEPTPEPNKPTYITVMEDLEAGNTVSDAMFEAALAYATRTKRAKPKR